VSCSLFERRELLRDPVLVAVPETHPLAADGGPVGLAALSGQPFLAPREGTSCAEMIQRACARAGFVPRVVACATDFQVLLSLVAAGAGVTLVPGLAARRLPPGVRLVPPAEPVTRRVFTVSRRGGDRKPAVRVVLDALTEAAAHSGGGPLAAEPGGIPLGGDLAQDLAARNEDPAVLADRPAQPGPGQPLQVVPGGQAVLHRPVAER
jgi:DNA-binding transcriptional LysR family regulator